MRERRLNLSLLHKEAARQLGVAATTVYNWERGRAMPEVRFTPRIIRFPGYDPHPAPRSLPERLAACRRKLGFSRRRFAKHLGVDESTLVRWERCIGRPSRRSLDHVQAFLRLH